MIWVENLTKYYPTRSGRHYVIRDATFMIPFGAKVGVIGRNGAGKSTLLRLISGIDMPNRGRVVREGHISWPMGLASGLQPMMSGRENARFACRIQGLGFDDIPPVLERIREFADIGKYFDMPVNSYSSGMRARINFAITMAFDFDCYIVDELTAVGDELFQKKSREVFAEKRRSAGLIMVSHALGNLMEECQSGLFLHEGEVRLFEDIQEAVEVYRATVGANVDEPRRKGRRGPARRRRADAVAAMAAAETKPASPPIAPAKSKPSKPAAARPPLKLAPRFPAAAKLAAAAPAVVAEPAPEPLRASKLRELLRASRRG
jgi:capsular polysaccharide transport system ATP-binding protein